MRGNRALAAERELGGVDPPTFSGRHEAVGAFSRGPSLEPTGELISWVIAIEGLLVLLVHRPSG
jgi:hypothetical protein